MHKMQAIDERLYISIKHGEREVKVSKMFIRLTAPTSYAQ